MPEHYSLLYHKVGFLQTQHQSFPDADLKDLSQVSQKAIEVVSKDGEIVYEDFKTVAKEVGEDCPYTPQKCREGVT